MEFRGTWHHRLQLSVWMVILGCGLFAITRGLGLSWVITTGSLTYPVYMLLRHGLGNAVLFRLTPDGLVITDGETIPYKTIHEIRSLPDGGLKLQCATPQGTMREVPLALDRLSEQDASTFMQALRQRWGLHKPQDPPVESKFEHITEVFE